MSLSTKAALVLFAVSGATHAQDVAFPPANRGFQAFTEPTIAAGELYAREIGLPNLESVSPTCVESTVLAMVSQDAAVRARGDKVTPWGTNGDPAEMWEAWGDDVARSCRQASAERLIAATREWKEYAAPAWRSVWATVLTPMVQASYWNRQRQNATPARCDDLLHIPKEGTSTRRRSRGAAPEGWCISNQAPSDVTPSEADRVALQIAMDIGLDDEQAAALNAFAMDVLSRGGVIHRQLVGELLCDRLSSFESPAAMGRALDQAESQRMEQEAALYNGLEQAFDAETISRIVDYAVEREPIVREVDHEAWFGKLPPAIVDKLVEVRCSLGIPGRDTSPFRRRAR